MEKAAPRISLLPGERRRERVLTAVEEAAYLKATQQIGDGLLEDYRLSLAQLSRYKRVYWVSENILDSALGWMRFDATGCR